MKLALLTLALCLPALATQVQDSDIRDVAGHKILSGVLKICPPGAFASGGWWISADCVTASIASGVINVSLVPGHYYVHWQSPARDDQMWFVPDSGTPLRIADAVTSSGWPLIALPPLTGSGVLKDVAGALDLVTGVPGDCVHVDSSSGPCGTGTGGAWGTITGALSSQSDLNAALSQKANLAGPVFSGQPTIPDFTLAGHTHLNPANGGTLNASAIAAGVLDIARIPTGTTNTTAALGSHTHPTIYASAAGKPPGEYSVCVDSAGTPTLVPVGTCGSLIGTPMTWGGIVMTFNGSTMIWN